VLGYILALVVPLISLNETIVLVREVPTERKITAAGIVVAAVLFFMFRRKISDKIARLTRGLRHGIARQLYNASTFGILYAIIWCMYNFSGNMMHWAQLSVIPILLGLVFFLVDDFILGKRAKQHLCNNKSVEEDINE